MRAQLALTLGSFSFWCRKAATAGKCSGTVNDASRLMANTMLSDWLCVWACVCRGGGVGGGGLKQANFIGYGRMQQRNGTVNHSAGITAQEDQLT